MKYKMEIKKFLFIWMLLLVFSALILLSALFYLRTKKILYSSLENMLKFKASMAVQEITEVEEDEEAETEESYEVEFDIPEIEGVDEFMKTVPSVDSASAKTIQEDVLINSYFILITDTTRQVLAYSSKVPSLNLNVSDFPSAQAEFVFFEQGISAVGRVRFVSISCKDAEAKEYYIYVGHSVKEADSDLRSILILLIILVLVGSVLISGGGYLIIHKAFQPVTNIIKNVQDLSVTDLTKRLDNPGTGDEIEQLTVTFNSLLDRIETAIEKIRQFTSDASHELRTPLTVMKNQIQVSLKKQRKPEEYIEVFNSLEEELDYLERMVEELLVLTRMQEGEIKLQNTQVDLAEHIGTFINEHYRSVSIDLAIPQDIVIEIYDVLFDLIFKNLIDNAIKFAAEKSEIVISADRVKNKIIITFSDTGPGVPESDLKKLFDKFYQVESSRTGHRGVGLGLNIVKSIVELHRGDISVSLNHPKGLSYKITFPYN